MYVYQLILLISSSFSHIRLHHPLPHPSAFAVYCSVLQYFTAFKYHYPYLASDLIILGLTPVCLQYITACYSVLQHVAACNSSPLSSPVFRIRLHHPFSHPNVLQYVAVCCGMLQYVAVSCCMYVAGYIALQYVAVSCSMLQDTFIIFLARLNHPSSRPSFWEAGGLRPQPQTQTRTHLPATTCVIQF